MEEYTCTVFRMEADLFLYTHTKETDTHIHIHIEITMHLSNYFNVNDIAVNLFWNIGLKYM